MANILRSLPPIEQVSPGLWTIPVPLPIESLRYVYVYVFMTSRGPYLVDTGWDNDVAWQALTTGLSRIGTDISQVQGIFITHVHPDHYGLVERVRQTSGCWVAMHAAEAEQAHGERSTRFGGSSTTFQEILRGFGASEKDQIRCETMSFPPLEPFSATRPEVVLIDDEPLPIPGWDVRAIWTPGHTPGHLCFYLPQTKTLLSGDHLLPRITPNVSFHPGVSTDPLGDFLSSLRKVAGLAPELVYPAHEYRFVGARDRVQDLVKHHESRLLEVLDAVEKGPATEWEIASRMTWSRGWDNFESVQLLTALGEAAAHIRALVVRGQLTSAGEDPPRWQRASA